MAVFFKQLVWIAFVPIWQFPDEQAHFGQVAYTFNRQVSQPRSNLTKEILITERILQTERDWAGNNKYTYHPEYNIPYTDTYWGRYEEEINHLAYFTKVTSSINEATAYPPLYYLPMAFIYQIFFEESILIRLFLARLFNLILSLLVLMLVYKIYKLVFEKEYIAICSAIFVSFQPMFSFLQGGINSDNLFNLIFFAAVYISLLLIKSFKISYLLLIISLYIAAVLTKPQGHLVVFVFFFPLVFWFITNKLFKTSIKIFFLILFLLVLAYFSLIGKIWLFLPEVYSSKLNFSNLSFFNYFKWTVNHSIREVLPWFWGVFRWLSLALPRIVNRLINRVMMLIVLGLFLYIFRRVKKRDFSFQTIALIFFIYIIVVYFLAITFWDYLFTLSHGFSFGIQGRYFFPVLSAIGGLFVFGILGFSVKEKVQKILSLILILFMILIHEVALFRVLLSYFSFASLGKFFLQASQYKPWFFKAPFLQFILLVHFLSLLGLLTNLTRIFLTYEKN